VTKSNAAEKTHTDSFQTSLGHIIDAHLCVLYAKTTAASAADVASSGMTATNTVWQHHTQQTQQNDKHRHTLHLPTGKKLYQNVIHRISAKNHLLACKNTAASNPPETAVTNNK